MKIVNTINHHKRGKGYTYDEETIKRVLNEVFIGEKITNVAAKYKINRKTI